MSDRSSMEARRLEAAAACQLADYGPVPPLDRLVSIATSISGSSVGYLDIVRDDCFQLISSSGLSVSKLPRVASLSERVVTTDSKLVVFDLLEDSSFPKEAHTIDGKRMRFYAGIPVQFRGATIGTLSIAHTQPIFLGDHLIQLLDDLGETASTFIRTLGTKRELDATHAENASSNSMNLFRMLIHDLKSPLTCARCEMALIKTLEDGPERDESLTALDSSLRHVTALTMDMLDILGSSATGLSLRRAPIDIRGFLQKAATNLAPTYRQAQQELVVSISESVQESASIDEVLLGRAFYNVLENASKFSPMGSKIALRCWAAEGSLLVEIHDSGPGIAESESASIFAMGSQGELGHRTKGGHGVGLTFCKLVVEAHGGRIYATTSERGGSIFTFELPIGNSSQDKDIGRARVVAVSEA